MTKKHYMYELSSYFKTDNPLFNEEKFLQACKYYELGIMPKSLQGYPQDTEKGIVKAYNYIIAITEKQGHLLECKELFGDGTRFKPLTYMGFECVYYTIKEMLEGVVIK